MPRRVLAQLNRMKGWRGLFAVFMPGGGRGAAYVLAQMGGLFLAASALGADGSQLRWLAALCGYICFFTGFPALTWRVLNLDHPAALQVRVSVLVLVLAATVLPDLAHYVFWQPDVLSLSFAVRHLVNPFRTLANWRAVEGQAWFVIPFAMGAAGAIAYVLLLLLGMRATGQPAPVRAPGAPPVTEEAGRANVLY